MHASMVDEKSPRFGASQTEMDISSEIENDSNFEKAEACSKELEDVSVHSFIALIIICKWFILNIYFLLITT